MLRWLPPPDDWRAMLARATAEASWHGFAAVARHRLDFIQTRALDSAMAPMLAGRASPDAVACVRLAILGSSTVSHIAPAIRVAALRHGIRVDVHIGPYGSYQQELWNSASELHRFRPDSVLFAFDSHHLVAGADPAMSRPAADVFVQRRLDDIAACWQVAQRALGCSVLQQMPLPLFPRLMGSNEHRLPGSRSALLGAIAAGLRIRADTAGVDVVAADDAAARDGLHAWHDLAIWHHAKQEIALRKTPVLGELVARLIAARLGLSRKCLVLDLDNTICGGVVGEDGVEAIELGPGTARGEAFQEVQTYLRGLRSRGIILAVCSRNERASALAPFGRHPGMVLRPEDFSAFEASWADKPTGVRAICASLGIGPESVVFLDDNPFERAQVRCACPMVAVPEVPDDPALVPDLLADAGYFESVEVTDEDRQRSALYRSRTAAQGAMASAQDQTAFLRGLGMQLSWSPIVPPNCARALQLVNKTNQFNLTGRRLKHEELIATLADSSGFSMQFRLSDRLGDHGVIAVVLGRIGDGQFDIATWVMSCRVLGREVEIATFEAVAQLAVARGANWVIGRYCPTPRNALVRGLLPRLGFELLERTEAGAERHRCNLDGRRVGASTLTIVEE